MESGERSNNDIRPSKPWRSRIQSIDLEYEESGISKRIIGCIINIHRALGPGFIEDVYRRALMVEMEESGLKAETEKEVRVFYRDEPVGVHRLDVLVEGKVILELKAVEEIVNSHYAQLRSYLKATQLPFGLLVNFSKATADVRRVERPFREKTA